jgi:hypothetical protein
MAVGVLYSTGYQLHYAGPRSKACFVVSNRVVFVIDEEVVIAQTVNVLEQHGLPGKSSEETQQEETWASKRRIGEIS